MELDDDSSKPYTCIGTHRGLYMYSRCPFGIHSAAPIFQLKMETLLKTVPKTVVFQDDILVTGKSQHEHLENLNKSSISCHKLGYAKGVRSVPL